MNKNILRTVLLVAGLLVAFHTVSQAFTLPIHMEIKPKYPLKLAYPIPVYIAGVLQGRAESTVDISLSDGLQLLKGDLHMVGSFNGGKRNGGYTVCEESLFVQINRPGKYEIAVSLNGTNLETPSFAQLLPLHGSTFLYAREDTVVQFETRKEMEQAIQDSMICPQEEQSRRWRIKTQKHRDILQERASKNLPPATISFNLDRVVSYLGLSSDSINIFRLSDYYDPDQVNFLNKYDLTLAQPRFERAWSSDLPFV